MKRILFVLISLITLVSGGCKNEKVRLLPLHGHLRVTHAASDAPLITVKVNDRIKQALSRLDYRDASQLVWFNPGNYSLTLQNTLLDQTTVLLDPIDFAVQFDRNYELVIMNNTDDLEYVILEHEAHNEIPESMLSFLHAANASSDLDIYVTAPDDDIDAAKPLASLSYGDDFDPAALSAGEHRIRITERGESLVLYDSGTLDFQKGSHLFFVLANNTEITDSGAVKSPLTLILNQRKEPTTTLYSVEDGVDVRIVHDAADIGAIDVATNEDFSNLLVQDLAFSKFTKYINISADTESLQVAETGMDLPLINENLKFRDGATYTLYALGPEEELEILRTRDDPRRVSTEARVRLVQGSPVADRVDIYVAAPSADLTKIKPVLRNIAFKFYTPYISLAEGGYSVTFTRTNEKQVLFGPIPFAVEKGKVYTAIIRDAPNLSSNYSLILLDDFDF